MPCEPRAVQRVLSQSHALVPHSRFHRGKSRCEPRIEARSPSYVDWTQPYIGFVLEEIRKVAVEHFQELLGGNRRAVGVPVGRDHHVLDRAGLAVGEFDLDLPAPLAV